MIILSFFSKLPKNIAGTFRNNNWVWHLVMMGVTFLLVESRFDWWYYEVTRIPLLIQIAMPAAAVGALLPILAPLGMYIIGMVKKEQRTKIAAVAVAEAGMIALLISSTYKAFTGRFQPQLVAHPPLTVDISEAFHFGFLRHGIFWGWPSSHTAVAFAMAVTFALLYRKNKTMFYSAIIYAMYIGLAVSITIHWFSDFVAGAILGTVIAFVVTKSFRTEKQNPSPSISSNVERT